MSLNSSWRTFHRKLSRSRALLRRRLVFADHNGLLSNRVLFHAILLLSEKRFTRGFHPLCNSLLNRTRLGKVPQRRARNECNRHRSVGAARSGTSTNASKWHQGKARISVSEVVVHRQNLRFRLLGEVEHDPASPAIANQGEFAAIYVLEFLFLLIVFPSEIGSRRPFFSSHSRISASAIGGELGSDSSPGSQNDSAAGMEFSLAWRPHHCRRCYRHFSTNATIACAAGSCGVIAENRSELWLRLGTRSSRASHP